MPNGGSMHADPAGTNHRVSRGSWPGFAQIADYSLPAGLCWPVVEARRLSIRRRPTASGRHMPVWSHRTFCCLWVMSTTTYVSPVSARCLCVPLTSPAALPPVPGLRAVSGVSASLG